METSSGGYLYPKFSVVYSVSELAALYGSVVACAYIAPIMGIMQTAFSLVHLGLFAIITGCRAHDSIQVEALVG